jgi:hypothetical protein
VQRKIFSNILVHINTVPFVGDNFKQEWLLWWIAERRVSGTDFEYAQYDTYEQRLGSPAINALTKLMSCSLISTSFLETRSSNIISEASSCFHFFPFLLDMRAKEAEKVMKTHKA